MQFAGGRRLIGRILPHLPLRQLYGGDDDDRGDRNGASS